MQQQLCIVSPCPVSCHCYYPNTGKSPSSYNLIEAAQYGHIERCRALVEEGGINVRVADNEGITPLHWASINNRFAVSRYTDALCLFLYNVCSP